MSDPANRFRSPGDAKAPGRLLQMLFRMPVAMYERRYCGYQRLFGREWLLLTTVGRKTGKPHRVMLDLVGHDPVTDRYYVQPGWGRRSDWVRNIEANPEVEVQVGSESFRALAENASGTEGAEWLFRFGRKHPLRNWLISRLLLRIRVPWTRDDIAVRAWLAEHLLVFALQRVRRTSAESPSNRHSSMHYAHAMEADDTALLFELFENTARQGPGSVATTRRALRLLPDSLKVERVLDLGCGTGGSTIVLAEDTGAQVTAVDIHPPFLATLRARAEERGLTHRITTVAADMANATALGGGFDLIWAEGSAYSIGFENALRRWRSLLRPAGCLVVTELVWFVAEPAERARAFFAGEYPDMRDEAARIDQARNAGYELIGSFRLPADDWHAYYAGLETSLRDAISRRGELEIYAATRLERAIYEACGDDYGYLCLILQVVAGSDEDCAEAAQPGDDVAVASRRR